MLWDESRGKGKWVATRCATKTFSTTCAVHIVRVGGCLDVVAQWQSTGGSSQVSWVWLPVAAGLFTFLYFCLITSKFIYRFVLCVVMLFYILRKSVSMCVHKLTSSPLYTNICKCIQTTCPQYCRWPLFRGVRRVGFHCNLWFLRQTDKFLTHIRIMVATLQDSTNNSTNR